MSTMKDALVMPAELLVVRVSGRMVAVATFDSSGTVKCLEIR